MYGRRYMSHSCSEPHVAWSNWKRTIDWSKGRRTGQALHRSSACVHTLLLRPFARSGIGTDLTEFTPSLRVPFILPRAKFTPICSPPRHAPPPPNTTASAYCSFQHTLFTLYSHALPLLRTFLLCSIRKTSLVCLIAEQSTALLSDSRLAN